MKLKLKYCLTVLFFIFFITPKKLFAQENITTARPTQAIGAWTIPANSFQFEQGFTYSGDTLVLDGFFRLAISKIGEIRMVTDYGSNKLVFGAKVMLLKPEQRRPGLALKVSIDNDFRVQDFRMIITQNINDRFSLFGNVGVLADDHWYGIVLLNIGLGDKFATYAEAYFQDTYQQYNTGLTYLINSETQLDFSVGLLNYDNSYVGVGFARRLKFDNLVHN